jgi:site-specific DNA-methyltransferase (adenine-specific)
MNNRKMDFHKISKSLSKVIKALIPNCILIEGNSLIILKQIPSNSISLIITDPPYHATKKKNIFGDTDFEEDEEYLRWINDYAVEWKRILKPNGSLFCFCDSSLAARLEVLLSDKFNVLSHIVWTKPNDPGFDGWKGKMKKEALRQWYPHSERILFAEPAISGNLHRSPFAHFLRTVRLKSGFTQNKLTELIGAHGKVNHGGAVSNWEAGRNTPSREQYEKICKVILDTKKIDSMPVYDDVVRVFNIDKSREFTDVWTFPSVRPYKGKHPAEKPIALLEHAINATTNPGDIVLDCFAGSGNSAFAALNLGRRAIIIEIDSKWVNSTISKLNNMTNTIESNTKSVNNAKKKIITKPTQLDLFGANIPSEMLR